MTSPLPSRHTGEAVLDDLQRGHLPFHHRDPARGQLLGLLVPGTGDGVQEQRQVRRPLGEQQRLVHREGPRGQDADRQVAGLPPVAVRAVQHVAPQALADPGDVRQLIDESTGDQQPPGAELATVVQPHGERPVVERSRRDDATVEQLHAVAADLGSTGRQQRGRDRAVPRQEAVYPGGRRVAGFARVDDQDRAPRPPEHQRSVEPGHASTDHHHVVGLRHRFPRKVRHDHHHACTARDAHLGVPIRQRTASTADASLA